MLFYPNYSPTTDSPRYRANAIGHAMSDEKLARLKSYAATVNALQAATGLPHAPNRDALQMWVRETGLVGAMVYKYYEVEK